MTIDLLNSSRLSLRRRNVRRGHAPGPANSEAGQLIWLAIAIVPLCLLIQAMISSDRWKAVFAGIGAVAALLAMLLGSFRLAPGLITPLFFIGFQIIPAVFFVVCMVTFPVPSMEMHPVPAILDDPVGTFIALVTPSVGFFVFSMVGRMFRDERKPTASLREMVRELPDHFELLLVVAAGLQFSIWITSDERFSDSGIAYMLRIMTRSLGIMPLLVGFCAGKFKKATVVWAFVLLVGVGLAFVTGSRGYAFSPMIPLLIGVFLGLDSWRKRLRVGLILLPLLGLVFLTAGLIGKLRVETGRLSVSEVMQGGVGRFVETSREIAKESSAGAAEDGGIAASAAARLVNWPNIVIPVMTPKNVPYRGFDDIGDEFRSFFELGLITGHTYWSNVFAIEYGFMVNESTSVEFGIAADGASRAGTAGAILYGFVAAVCLGLIEWVSRSVFRQRPGVFVLCVFVLGGAASTEMVRTGLFASVRSAFVGVCVLAIFFGVLDAILGSSENARADAKPGRRMGSRGLPTRPWHR